MTFEVVVLGSAGTHPGPGRACSGYLFRTANTRVMVDCGNGSTMNLQRVAAIEQVDAFLLTHLHPDHCVDLIGVYYALRFHPDGPLPVDVYAAEGTQEQLAGLLSGDVTQTFAEVCRFQKVGGGDRLEIGDISFELFPSIHPVPTVSVRAEVDGKVAVYSSDSAGGDDLPRAARDADLFVCEATWQGDRSSYPAGVHLTAADAGSVATGAGARRLVLTHLWPVLDAGRSLEEARTTFDGPLELAEDGQVWAVG